MNFLFSAVLFSSILGGPRFALQEPDRIVQGVLFASSEGAQLTKLEKAFEYGMPFLQLSQKVATESVLVVPWGRRSAIVIDLRAGPFLDKHQKASLGKVLLRAKADSLTVRLGDLGKEDFGVVRAAMEEMEPQFGRLSERDISNMKFGVYGTVNYQLLSGGRELPLHVNVLAPDERGDTRSSMMGSVPSLDQLPEKERSEITERWLAGVKKRSTLTLRTAGVAQQNFAEGVSELARIIEREMKKLDQEGELIAKEICERLKIAQDPRSTEARKALNAHVIRSWRALGFKDQEDAEKFLKDAEVGQVRTWIGIGYKSGPATIIRDLLSYDSGKA